MAGERVHLKIDNYGAKCIDEYLEYSRIVGDDDGGTPFTPAQYEQYKKKVLPARTQNRIFVAWTSSRGIDCKLIGPQTLCFCHHRYIQHKTDFMKIPDTRPIKIPCGVHGCPCKSYNYVPLNGSQPLRCHCKHLANDHSVIGKHKCKKDCGCVKFESSYTCGCGEPAYSHKMILETKEERLRRGHPIGHDTMYKAMGGLTGFSSLADGYMRLDDSGMGAPPPEFLNQPIGVEDHPFLRMYDGIEKLSLKDREVFTKEIADRKMVASSGRRADEDDMAYFERRYQERLKAERERSRQRNGIANKSGGKSMNLKGKEETKLKVERKRIGPPTNPKR